MQDSETINVGDYGLLFVDILNQKQELDRIRQLPESEEDRRDFIISLQNSIGKVSSYRELFDGFFLDCLQYQPPKDEGVSDELYQKMVDLVKIEVKRQVFSDTMIYFTPFWAGSKANPIMTLHTLLIACGATFINTLSVGMVCRGSLEFGIGGEFFDGEIYGPVLADAYFLESQVAEYPRIVIGDKLYSFLEGFISIKGQALDETFNGSMAESCLGLIGIDDDGQRILDYLGEEARKVIPYAQTLIPRAVDFATQQLAIFKQQGNAKLANRYERLLAYLSERRDRYWK